MSYINRVSNLTNVHNVTGSLTGNYTWIDTSVYNKRIYTMSTFTSMITNRELQGKSPVSEESLKMIIDMYNSDDNGASIIADRLIVSLFEL